MGILKNRIIHFLIIISAIILIDLISFETALPADNTQIILDGNLKPGMALKNAIKLLGPPEKIIISDTGTVIIPYDADGLSIEIMSDGTLIDTIHINSSFKGRFASGIEIGADFQEILSKYNQPDIMTKEIIEYSDLRRRFQIHEGKLTGADIYSEKSLLYGRKTNNESVVYKDISNEIPEEVQKEVREELREKLREEVKEELREEVLEEVNKEVKEDFDAFDLFGFNVNQTFKGVVITEIRPDSVAEYGGLKLGEPVRKAFYNGGNRLNIYTVGGLKKILTRAVKKHKKTINILQDKNYYYKVEVPKRQ